MLWIIGLAAIAVGHNVWAIVRGHKTICATARDHPYLTTGFCAWFIVHLVRGRS